MKSTDEIEDQLTNPAGHIAMPDIRGSDEPVIGHDANSSDIEALEAALEAYLQSTATSPGRLNGWVFDRDEINRRV